MSFTRIIQDLYVGELADIASWRKEKPQGTVIACLDHPEADVCFPFEDDWLGGMSLEEKDAAVAASYAASHTFPAEVLIVCREGRNRSCLVAALLMQQGGQLRADYIIQYIRDRRSPYLVSGEALSNRHFERFLYSRENL